MRWTRTSTEGLTTRLLPCGPHHDALLDPGVAAGAVAGLAALTRLALDGRTRVAWHPAMHLGVAGVAAGLALAAGTDVDDLGLDPRRLIRGSAVGAAAGGAMVAPMLVGRRRDHVRQRLIRAAETLDTERHPAHVALVRIPLNTALYEEMLFRGALLALLGRVAGPWRAALVSSLAFGVWHMPEVFGRTPERAGRARWRTVGESLATLAFTGSAGLVFVALRRATRSLAAPVVAHAVVNGAGHAVAVAAWRSEQASNRLTASDRA